MTDLLHLNSPAASEVDADDDDYSSELDDDLKESIEQLEQLLSLVIFPIAGKFLGRKFAFHVWARWLDRRRIV
ncbi:mitochondrial MIM complex subunit Mim2 [Schizosaccharomyces osmophilus]|uniref:Mitochondrial MIM complex subunit Mim2 n=1 Tax=Schizosaccharomyces osmophilus TaxID=2545709 RepID=A0AAE9W754_9SCHI|nr:mitochondrial MIM complex subunit Mim2 [Schizosaccharomyces osmophilus]WBW71145.1 mitochondrial MIM complex subunit Mim2 [Schizosaccharomyces osmophilus]